LDANMQEFNPRPNQCGSGRPVRKVVFMTPGLAFARSSYSKRLLVVLGTLCAPFWLTWALFVRGTMFYWDGEQEPLATFIAGNASDEKRPIFDTVVVTIISTFGFIVNHPAVFLFMIVFFVND
jgi:hypothetical protein